MQILRNVRAAAGTGAAVLLIEAVIPQHNREFIGNWLDLEMLLGASARERTAAEYRDLLGQAGLRMTRVVKPPRRSASWRQNPVSDGRIQAGARCTARSDGVVVLSCPRDGVTAPTR